MGNYPRILVRMVGMIIAADILDDRIDLDSIDLARSKSQCVSKIVPRSRTDDQHIAKRAPPLCSCSRCIREYDEPLEANGTICWCPIVFTVIRPDAMLWSTAK